MSFDLLGGKVPKNLVHQKHFSLDFSYINSSFDSDIKVKLIELLEKFKNQQFLYKCQQLKSATMIYSVWFFKNFVNVKLTENGRTHEIFHVTNFESFLETVHLEEYINDASF